MTPGIRILAVILHYATGKAARLECDSASTPWPPLMGLSESISQQQAIDDLMGMGLQLAPHFPCPFPVQTCSDLFPGPSLSQEPLFGPVSLLEKHHEPRTDSRPGHPLDIRTVLDLTDVRQSIRVSSQIVFRWRSDRSVYTTNSIRNKWLGNSL